MIFDMDEAFGGKQVLVFLETKEIHEQLKIKRISDQFTQTELAEILGMGVSTLCEIETGKRRVPFKSLKAVQDYLYHQWWEQGNFVERIEQPWGDKDEDEL